MTNIKINTALDAAGLALVPLGVILLTDGEIVNGAAILILGLGVITFKYYLRDRL